MVPAGEGALDTEGMFEAAAGLPEQLETAWRADLPVGALPPRASFDAVVVLGMGGSAVAGDLLASLAALEASLPVVSTRGYAPPAFVGPRTLVLAVSFSGETEETLEATAAALARGARVVAVTRGGALAALVDDGGGAVIALPGGIPQPRAAIAAMAVPVLRVAEAAGALAGLDEQLASAARQLRRRRDELVAPDGGLARSVARRLGATVPLVWGATGVTGVAARRWKTQVNENAKAPAFSSVQPELCHNEVCGFGQLGDLTRQCLTIVALRSPDEHPGIAARFAIVSELVEEAVARVVEVHAEGDGPLAQFFDLVAVGDFVSLHLARAFGVDPGPVPVLAEVKQRLRAARGPATAQGLPATVAPAGGGVEPEP